MGKGESADVLHRGVYIMQPKNEVKTLPRTDLNDNILHVARLSARIEYEEFSPPEEVKKLPSLYVYVDETSDRGQYREGSQTSPIFGMAAVVVEAENEAEAQCVVESLRSEFRVPDRKPMSWKEHLKLHERRVHAALKLSGITGMRVIYGVVDKRCLKPGGLDADRVAFYNYLAYRLLRKVLFAAHHWEGGPRQVIIHFGSVRGHDDTDTHRYFQIKRAQCPEIPFELLSKIDWVSADRYKLSQAADLYGGFLKAALWPSGEFKILEPRFILEVWHQIYSTEHCPSDDGPRSCCPACRGLMMIPRGHGFSREWWPCECIKLQNNKAAKEKSL